MSKPALVWVQVHSWGRVSTGGNAGRRHASSTDTSWSRLSIGRNAGRCCASSPAEARMQVHVKGRLTRGNAGNPAPSSPRYTCRYVADCQQGAMSVGGEQAPRVCVQVHSWDRLSTGGSADRHCTSSHDTVGADCQREATPAGAAPARPYMPADTRPGLLVNGS